MMSVELTDAQFLKLLGLVDCQIPFTSGMQANVALAHAARNDERGEPDDHQPVPFPPDFMLNSKQSSAVQVGVDIFMYASTRPGEMWIAPHSLGWIQWLFVKSWFLMSTWVLERDNEAIDHCQAMLTFLLKEQVGTSGDDRSFDNRLMAGLVGFSSRMLEVEAGHWREMQSAYSRLQKIVSTFKDSVGDIYTRVKSLEIKKLAQCKASIQVCHFFESVF